MPTHYIYENPNKSELTQGDVLERGEALDPLLSEYFPYYFQHRDYHYFIVLTQSCDLVRRDGEACGAPYITIAAVRPVRDVLLLEAAKLQVSELQQTNIIGNKGREKLAMFLESLMDNNKPGFFYLHADPAVGISQPSCAFLQLSISFRSEHYSKCLLAKLAQLKEPFQAKLGWLIGNMYSRVATTEWDTERPGDKVGAAASKILKGVFLNYDDEQIKAALADIREDTTKKVMTSEEIKNYIKNKKMVPKLKQFKDQVEKKMGALQVIEPIKDNIASSLRKDDSLRGSLEALFRDGGELTPEAKAIETIRLVAKRIREFALDEAFPNREKYISDLVGELMADTVLKSFIKN
jgi:hypothetical protein